MVSNEFSYGKNKETDGKYLIRYKNDKKIRLWLIKFPHLAGLLNKSEKPYYKSFVIKDEKLLKKYDSIWNKLSSITKKKIDKQPVYDIKHLNTKLKFYNGNINIAFYAKGPPKKDYSYFWLAAIILDSVCKIKKKDDKYYPQIYLETFKYEEKTAMKKYTKENIVITDGD